MHFLIIFHINYLPYRNFILSYIPVTSIFYKEMHLIFGMEIAITNNILIKEEIENRIRVAISFPYNH